MLAATTRGNDSSLSIIAASSLSHLPGFDVTNYIIHSPGISDLDPMGTDQILDPDRYASERLAKVSMKVIAISMAISRCVVIIYVLQKKSLTSCSA